MADDLAAIEAPDIASSLGVVKKTFFNPAMSSLVITNNNLTATKSGSGYQNAFSNESRGTKVYAEVHCDSSAASGRLGIGVADGALPIDSSRVGSVNTSVGYYSDGSVYKNGVLVLSHDAWSPGDWLGVAADRVAQTVQFRNITHGGAVDHLGALNAVSSWIQQDSLGYFRFTIAGTWSGVIATDVGHMGPNGDIIYDGTDTNVSYYSNGTYGFPTRASWLWIRLRMISYTSGVADIIHKASSTSGSWSSPISTSTGVPLFLIASADTNSDAVTANFDDSFVGAIPDGYTRWDEAGFGIEGILAAAETPDGVSASTSAGALLSQPLSASRAGLGSVVVAADTTRAQLVSNVGVVTGQQYVVIPPPSSGVPFAVHPFV